MSDTELLLKKVEGLPAGYMAQIFDFIDQLKHKVPPTGKTAASEWVNPLKGRARALGSKLTYNRFMEMQEADKNLERKLEP
ncbi:hypothetical protein FACS189447_09810 [Spirochaetia bacterium]|nr:hypothetical protein FACS189447_09810 [Spirochaetia bacterium]GHV95793.1 hypothetical protein AGMMS50293_21130 [Spirochaetia bacterium]